MSLADRSPKATATATAERLDRWTAELADLPVLDPRTADEIIGYDEHGLPR